MGIQINGQTDTISALDNNFSLAGNVSIGGTLTYEDVTSVDAVGLSTFQAGIHIDDSIAHLGDTDTKIRFPANDTFTLETAGSERLRITSAGLVGINESAPDRKLVISQANGTAYSPSDFDQDYHVLRLKNTTDSQTVGMQFLIGSNGEAAISATETSDGNTDIAFGTRGGGARKERIRLRSNGDLILGPYDTPGSYTTSANNVPYSIKVAPYGWQHHSELAEISMGNHSGSNGNDDGEIVFKTTQNAHSSTTGLVERLRITSGGNCGIGITNPEKNLVVSSSSSPTIRINNSDGSISADQIIGAIEFKSNDGSGDGSQVTGSIESISQAAFTGQGSPSHLIFKTNGVSGANALQERFRIKSNGDLKHTGLRIGGGDNKLAILVTPSHNTNEEDVIVYQVENEGSFNQITFGGGTSAYNAATQISFKTASAVDTTGGSESLRITSGGNVAIGADAYGNVAPLSKLHVSSTGTTTAIGADHGYLRSSCQILCQSSDNVNNSKSGIMFSGALHSTDGCSAAVVATHENVAENSETTSLSFYTSHNETLKESLKITSHSQFEMNGVRNIYQSFVLVNNQNYNWDFTVPNEGGYGNSFYLVAGYNHYYTTSYGAHRTVWFSARGTSVNGMGNGIEQTSGNAGSWTFSKPNATTVRITKTSGTYGGSGYGFFHLTYNHF